MDVYLSGNIHIFHILKVHSFKIFFRSSIIKFESVMRKTKQNSHCNQIRTTHQLN